MRSNEIDCKNITAKIDTLTGARFLAIMVIVFSHFEFLYNYKWGLIYKTYFHNAKMGVDFFFLLSGFGMMHSNIIKNGDKNIPVNGIKDLFKFAINHVKKIYPVYIITILIGIPLYIIKSIVDYGEPLVLVLRNLIIKLIPCVFLVQSALGIRSFTYAFNGVAWFLSSLFCIYFVCPCVINWLRKHIDSRLKIIIFLVLDVLISVLLAYIFSIIENINPQIDLVYGSPYRRIFYVIEGMILAILYDIQKDKEKMNRKYIIGIETMLIASCIIWFVLRNTLVDKIGLISYVIDMGLCGCILYFLARNMGLISHLFSGKRMIFLGKLSKYIFLIHCPILNYINYFVVKLGFETEIMALIEVVIILLITFTVSIVLYKKNL